MSAPERKVGFLLGLPFHVITMQETIDDAVARIDSGVPAYYVTANADFIAQAFHNEVLKDILFHADRVVCDGMPLVWLSRYFKPALPERVAGSDMVFQLFAQAQQHRWKVYFLGSDDATLARSKQILSRDYPDMQIVGTFSPPFGTVDSWPNETILAEIKACRPDLLLVAVGCPKQEYWIHRYYLDAQVPLTIGIGASLDFICGTQTRAPRWVQQIGMEWCWRLLTNPKRLFKRYAKDFYYLILLARQQRRLMVAAPQPGGVQAVQSSVVPRSSIQGPRVTADGPGSDPSPPSAESGQCPAYHLLKWSGEVTLATIDGLPGAPDSQTPVLIDLSEVRFIDSSGVGLLAKLARDARAARQGFGLIQPSEPVIRIIETMHLAKQFPAFADPAQALCAFSTQPDSSSSYAAT